VEARNDRNGVVVGDDSIEGTEVLKEQLAVDDESHIVICFFSV
jgi:hypothetical protein